MVTLSHLYINTDATKLAIFKLSDLIGLIYWTHILQCETQSDMPSILTALFVLGKVKLKLTP